MNRLIRYYNQNRKKVWITIGIVLLAIIVIQLLNYFAKTNKKNTQSNKQNTVIASVAQEKGYAIMSDTQVDTSKNKTNNQIIEQFILHCNNGNVNEAYDLLTDECKEVMYPNLNMFIENYYQKVFKGKRTYDAQSWMVDRESTTYKVRIMEDMLDTGNYKESGVIEDYYTIKDNKININKYIGREQIGKTRNQEEVTITIVSKDMYVDYEIYHITANNKRKTSIALDSKETTSGTYLIGNKKRTTYSSLIHEIDLSELLVKPSEEKELKIKFNKMYDPEISINSINFMDMLLDYGQNTQKKSEMTINF